jgi:hypothetical protein
MWRSVVLNPPPATVINGTTTKCRRVVRLASLGAPRTKDRRLNSSPMAGIGRAFFAIGIEAASIRMSGKGRASGSDGRGNKGKKFVDGPNRR